MSLFTESLDDSKELHCIIYKKKKTKKKNKKKKQKKKKTHFASVSASRNQTYIILIPLNPTFVWYNWGLQGYTLFISFLLKNIDYGYSLEPPRTMVDGKRESVLGGGGGGGGWGGGLNQFYSHEIIYVRSV